MSYKLAVEIYQIELWHLISLLLIVTVNFHIYLNARKNQVLYSYLSVELLLFVWILSKLFKTVSPTEEIRWFFIVTQYVGNCFIGPAFYIFSVAYNQGRIPRKKRLILLTLPAFVFFLCMATNPLHMLFYSYYDFYRDSFGPIFYLNQVYVYLLVLSGAILCGKRFFTEHQHKRNQAALILIAVAIPLIINILYVMKLFYPIFGFRPLFDITPVACNLSLLFFAIASYRYRFFDISAIAWRTVFDGIPDGILIRSNEGVVIDANRSWNEIPEPTELIKVVSAIRFDGFGHKDILYETISGTHYRIKMKTLKTRMHNAAMIRLINETELIRRSQELQEKNQVLLEINRLLDEKAAHKRTLSVLKTRNLIGREVHDVLGHSIILVLLLLEVSRLKLYQNLSETKEKVDQAIELLLSAQNKTQESMLPPVAVDDDDLQDIGIVGKIKKLVVQTRSAGQLLDLTVQGEEYSIPNEYSEAAVRLCQEAITNAIRHGKADRISLVLRFLTDKLELYIIDNGVGCESIHKGYGIMGMEHRIVDKLGGKLRYGSLDGGFSISAELPLSNVIS